jgi:hypothetical protein
MHQEGYFPVINPGGFAASHKLSSESLNLFALLRKDKRHRRSSNPLGSRSSWMLGDRAVTVKLKAQF